MKKITLFLSGLLSRILETFRRFPVSMVVIVLAFGLMIVNEWSYNYGWEPDQEVYRVISILWIILPIFTSITLFFKQRWGLFLGLIAGVVLYFSTGNGVGQQETVILMMWGAAFYSLMFILPHWKRNQNNGFWNYCAQILFVLILGQICTGILAASLLLAIESVRGLFQLAFDYRWDGTMALFSFFFVLPIFVHIGLPQEWEDLEKSTDYPHFFKSISYYLLTPISLLYFAILAAYVVKIMYTQVWPSGQVAYPVIYLSMLVFGSYLISYPWRKEWNKWFFVALLPFMAVYFIALGMRVQQYGLTELRYLGLLLGICLTLMSFYFAFVKRQRLQMMLIPLALVAFVFAMGPWGVNDFPVISQEQRLENLLMEVGALKDGKLVVVDASTLSYDQKLQISSMVEYLSYRNHLDDLQAWTDVNLDDNPGYDDRIGSFLKAIGLEYTSWYGSNEESLSFNFNPVYTSSYYVAGFDGVSEFGVGYNSDYVNEPVIISWPNGEELSASLNADGFLTLQMGSNSIVLSMMALRSRLLAAGGDFYNLDPEDLMFEAQGDDFKVKLYLNDLSGSFTDENKDSLNYLNVSGKLLVNFK